MFDDIVRNTLFRIALLVIPTVFVLIRRKYTKLDRFVILYILLAIGTELFTLIHEGYNLVQYSLFSFLEVLFISLIVFQDVRKKTVIVIPAIVSISTLIFFFNSPYSSLDLLKLPNSFPLRSPIDTHQFFDLCSINNLIAIVLTFVWLIKILNVEYNSGENIKRLIYVFSFLGYYCGSFFTIAFGRYIIGDISLWFEFWNKIYLPLYILFYLTLNIGLLWKTTPQSSSY